MAKRKTKAPTRSQSKNASRSAKPSTARGASAKAGSTKRSAGEHSSIKRSATERAPKTESEKTRRDPKKPRPRREAEPAKPVAPNPSDLERPAPNEPVRIQPPVPEFAQGSRPAERDVDTEPPTVDEDARAEAMESGRRRLRNDPDRRRAGDRSRYDANRWVHQRANQPRGGLWQTHSHTTRGR